MQPHLVVSGGIGLNLTLLVSWEWNPEHTFLVIHMINDTLYVRGHEAQALGLLLDTLATLRMGQPPPRRANEESSDA